MKCVALSLWIAAAPWAVSEQVRVQFFLDEDESSLSIHELQFASASRGMALGIQVRKGKAKPVGLVTSDGGATWRHVSLKEDGLSLFFLDEQTGWMVTDEGVWGSSDGGESFQKLAKLKGAARVHFRDPKHGFAVGGPKRVWETTDGGKTWNKVSAADEPEANPNRSIYAWIEFANPELGVIVGWHEPERFDGLRFPVWMDPERAQRRRQWPSLTLMLQTVNGGKSWHGSATSLLGKVTRVRLDRNGRGYALVEFDMGFEWPSEVYLLDFGKQDTPLRVLRSKERAVTDLALLRNGSVYAVAVEPPGSLRQLPVPGRLHVLRSKDGTSWEELKVDYRAVARRAVVAARPEGPVWVATDTGMILQVDEAGPTK